MPNKHLKDKMRPISLLLFFAFLAAGCGGSETSSDSADDAGAAEASETTMEVAPMGTASVSGMVSFEGDAPERAPIRMKPECMDQHDSDPLSDVLVVGGTGGVQSAFVFVSSGLPEDMTFPTPDEPAVLDQYGCMYVPHVMGVQTGQTIRIENSDPFQHNIHPIPEINRGFNESTPNEGDYLEKAFLVAEIPPIEVKCDVHPWMLAYVGVLDHPYFAVSDADGNFSIEGLPAGEYTVTAWHSTLGTQEMTVTVGDGEAASAGFTFASAG